jgi:hypothetical protein
MPFRVTKTPLERFEAFFVKVDGCWLWNGTKKDQGYGNFHWNVGKGRSKHIIVAHRASWLLYRGEVPAGLLVLHRCDTPACVNPDHLFLGTNQDNIDDRNAKGRQVRGEKHLSARLTPDIVRKIREVVIIPSDLLAAELGVTVRTINQIRSGETWRHLL